MIKIQNIMSHQTIHPAAVLLLILIAISGYQCQQVEKNNESPVYLDWTITDSIVELAIEQEIYHHPEITSHLIDVQVINGIASLSGSTDNILAKERSAEVAATVKGVKRGSQQHPGEMHGGGGL
jgi:osmotically-inducible protein OsmY